MEGKATSKARVGPMLSLLTGPQVCWSRSALGPGRAAV